MGKYRSAFRVRFVFNLSSWLSLDRVQTVTVRSHRARFKRGLSFTALFTTVSVDNGLKIHW